MDKTKWPAIGGLLLGIFWLSRTVPTTFAFDKPLLSSSVLLACVSLAVLALGRFIPGREGSREGNREDEQALPLNELGRGGGRPARRSIGHSSRVGRGGTLLSSLRRPGLRHILIAAIVLRVEILRKLIATSQCTALSWEPLIPFAFACWDYWSAHRDEKRPVYEESPDASIYDVLEQRAVRSRYRYLVTVGLISFGGLLALATTQEPRTTFICAATLYNRWLIPFLQRLGTVLDIAIAYVITSYLEEGDKQAGPYYASRGSSQIASLGSALLRAAQISSIWSVILFITYLIVAKRPEERWRMFELPGHYIWSLLQLGVLSCCTLVCALLSILHIGLINACLLSTFVLICTSTTTTTLNHLLAYPPTQNTLSFIAICVTILAFAIHFHIATAEYRAFAAGTNTAHSPRTLFKRSVPGWLYIILLLFFFLRTVLWARQSGNTVNYHPIDMLIYDAQFEHDSYRRQASASTTLDAAVANYRSRYNRYPPPGFDQWYKYATDRNSVIIDDYDIIHGDLQPFYALTPAEIRHRTKQLLQNPWHDATGVSIRDGKAAISSHVADDHRWMMEQVVGMIEQFSKWLPDMDIAFNVNDQPAIAVPWHDLDRMQKAASQIQTLSQPANEFSDGRAAQWELDPYLNPQDEVMEDLGWQNTFQSHGAVHCPPGSPARSERHWDHSKLCTHCASKHSLGNFPANWTVMSDVCHQPDLAELHGFYTSPSAFHPSHELLPLFSQSKAPGYNDILYPSAWNWIGKVKYAPTDEFPDVPFANKISTLFWRGATSEGMSPDNGAWKGISRQRFLHILNDINVAPATQAILLPYTVTIPPDTKDEQQPVVKTRLKYTPVPISTLTSLVKTDVHFVHNFQRCWDIDCPHQEAEFGLAEPTDFQAHWQYKYLLDLDGAGFSGRFLPFLNSRSLPFKAALFREWWDDRLTPWLHFVPLDLRGQGVWGTLVYFAGLSGRVNGREVRIEGKEAMGERIAEKGREWAGMVLRREDMEIYFFRLLLEWGRLVDDGRDAIGFSGHGGG